MSIHLRDGLRNQSVDHVLEDILVRFVVNVPKEDLSSLERMFFQVEEGQWFYADFMRELNSALPPMKMKSFAPKLLSKCPLVWKWGDPSEALSQFGKYKSTIPVRGIALMNKDLTKVLLVRGPESGSWSFPRGKISKDESDIECAIREVREETSFDARNYVNDDDFLERTIGGKNFRMYLARDVPENFNFEPMVRCEIADIKWFNIKTLRKAVRTNHNKYFVVSAMMEPLNSWINKQKGQNNDEALMRETESKLKQLMGLNDPEPVTHNDAGRELLNILQASQPATKEEAASSGYTWNPPVNVPMALPQHLQNVYSGVGQVPQFFPFLQNSSFPLNTFPVPSFNAAFQKLVQPPQPPLPPQFAQALQNSSNQSSVNQGSSAFNRALASNPVPTAGTTASKQSNSTNSKELLSILKGETTVKESTKPRALEESKSLKSSTPERAETPPVKKITLLKKNKSVMKESDSAALLSILGKKSPSPESPKSQRTKSHHANGHSFLSILNRGRKKKEHEPTVLIESTQPVRPVETSTQSSAQSFGSLTHVQTSPIKNNANAKENGDISAPAQFLSILKKDSGAQPTAANTASVSRTATESFQLSVLDLSAGNQILSMLNRNSNTPRSVQYSNPVNTNFSQFENFDDFENFEDFDDISDSQNIYNSIARDFDTDEEAYSLEAEFHLPLADSTTTLPLVSPPSEPTASSAKNDAGAGLLQLLRGGPSAARGPYLSLQDTYGTSPQAAALPQQPNLHIDNSRANSNGAQILRLLKREKQ